MGNFLSKLVTGNPFANESLSQTLVNPSLMPGVRGAPQINLTSMLGGKGGAQAAPNYAGMQNIRSPQSSSTGVPSLSGSLPTTSFLMGRRNG